MSLDEFVDSLIVANMLDLKSMTVISVGSPVALVIAAIYMLFGTGGSTNYALCIGERNTKRAGKYFSVSIIAALVIGVLIATLGNVFLKPLCGLLCADASLLTKLEPYMRVVLFTAPLIIGVQTFSNFLPAAGVPNLATVICIIANVSNIFFDYVLIRFFNSGVEGTAYATLLGYAICIIVLAIMALGKKFSIHVSRPSFKDFKLLKDAVGQGCANAIGQIGYTIKYAFFNAISFSLGGSVGLQSFAVCQQILSIMSIGLTGVVDATTSFMAVLRGQKDTEGTRIVLRSGIFYNTLFATVLVALFEAFPQLLFMMFNVTDKAVIAVATSGIRIFMLLFLVRGIYILYMCHARIIGRKIYSMVISLLDGFAFLLPTALLCTCIFGLDGVWISFPLTSVLILLGMVVYNKIVEKKSNGKLQGFFLLEREENVKKCDMTIGENNEEISLMSRKLTDFCIENGVNTVASVEIGLIAEEMAVYTRLHRKKTGKIDVLTRIFEKEIVVDFRSEGTPFNPLAQSEEDNEANIKILNKIPSDISYDYILGMNSTRFTVAK